MRKRKATLNEVCKDENLPGKGTVLGYAEANPSFREKLLETYHAPPYEVPGAGRQVLAPVFLGCEKTKVKGVIEQGDRGKGWECLRRRW